jgi:hypothetical protein
MINASKYHKTLVLFVDHTTFLKGLRPDVIVGQTYTQRPPAYVNDEAYVPLTSNTSSHSASMVGAEKQDVECADSYDSDSDDDAFEFCDSDFDAEDGDDDLFAENVDKSVNDHNEQELCQENEDEDAPEDDDLNVDA